MEDKGAVSYEVRALCGDDEADAAARVCKRGFNRVQVAHLGRMVTCLDEAQTCRALRALAARHKTYAIVACERETGRVIGSNFLDQRDEVASIGPISVDPDIQAAGAGRALMQAVIDKGLQDGHKSIRLLQEAHNLVSFALYAKLGFASKEQINIFMGRSSAGWPEPKLELEIRPMTSDDLTHCAALHKRIVGVARDVELADCLKPQWAAAHDPPMVAVEQPSGRVVGYATSITSVGHGVGESDEVVARLHHEMTQRAVPAGRRDDDMVLKLIGRQSPTLMQWALAHAGLRLQRNMTLMALGEYSEPSNGHYMPSVMY